MQNHIRITFIGDLMCQKEQSEAAYKRHGSFQYQDTFKEVRSLFKDSDWVIGNLETPLAGEECGYSSETFRFNTPDTFVEAIRDAGIGFVSIANNHILDRGITGLDRTIQILNNYGIGHTGAYTTLENADHIEVREIQGVKIAVLAFTYGTNSEFYGEPLPKESTWRVDLLREQTPKPDLHTQSQRSRRPLKYYLPVRARMALSALAGKTSRRHPEYIADNVPPDQVERKIDLPFLDRAKAKILRARQLADFVIVLPHMGGQYNPAPGSYSRHIAEWLSHLGPNAIVANHPHVPLECHLNEQCLTAYSLGNFCFNPSDGCLVPGQLADYSIVLHLDICPREKRTVSVSFQITKTVTAPDGLAMVYPVSDLLRDTTDLHLKEKILIDQEAVVNRFLHSHRTAVGQDLHTYPIPT